MRKLLFVLAMFVGSSTGHAAESIDFHKHVYPILETYCIGCHTADDAEGGIALDSHDAIMVGGESGVAVTAGAANSSRLMLMVRGSLEPVMPPEGEERPTDDQIAILESWIDQGATGPDGEMPIKRELSTPEIKTAPGVQLPVTALSLSAGGDLKAVARFGEVRITNAAGDVVSTIRDLPGKVNSLQLSRDGRRLLVASGVTGAYGLAAIYEVATGDLVSEMIGHRDTLYAAVFSPDETIVATAGYDRDISLWDVNTTQLLRTMQGHNGAIFDLAFSPDGSVLASACADETVKVWHVESGQRLDTLSQSEGEVFVVDFTGDGKYIIAGSGDNRLRVWRFVSKQRPRINPLVATRFVDESPLVNFALSPSGDALAVLSASGNIKVIRTADWNQAAVLEPIGDTGSDLCITPDGTKVLIATMSGRILSRNLPSVDVGPLVDDQRVRPIYLDLADPTEVEEESLRSDQSESPSIAQAMDGHHSLRVGRGATIRGKIGAAGEVDHFQWTAAQGEVWAIDADATTNSPLDPIVSMMDESGHPVLRTRLQAIRDSYFTFRGKNSTQVNDFRVFNWQEMNLGQYLYAAGEVTRLWMHPRGPDSGFNVYPGEGNRWTYFGTTHAAHALGEPAFIVRPLGSGQEPIANGLPVIDIYYENDDDPMRVAGKNSRLLFTAPRDGVFTVRIADTRGDGGQSFDYALRIRAAKPGFQPSIAPVKSSLRRGAGREFIVRADRVDGYQGPVSLDCPDLPPEIRSNFPIVIEAGQRFAVGTLWIDRRTTSLTGNVEPEVIGSATIGGRKVERSAGKIGNLTVGGPPSVTVSIQPIDGEVADDEDWTLSVRRGETVSARVVLQRKEGFTGLVSFGKEDSGRNVTQGVYVDNIGLNGLLVLPETDQREFFLTADRTAAVGKRPFFLTANTDGKVTSHPITVEVLP